MTVRFRTSPETNSFSREQIKNDFIDNTSWFLNNPPSTTESGGRDSLIVERSSSLSSKSGYALTDLRNVNEENFLLDDTPTSPEFTIYYPIMSSGSHTYSQTHYAESENHQNNGGVTYPFLPVINYGYQRYHRQPYLTYNEESHKPSAMKESIEKENSDIVKNAPTARSHFTESSVLPTKRASGESITCKINWGPSPSFLRSIILFMLVVGTAASCTEEEVAAQEAKRRLFPSWPVAMFPFTSAKNWEMAFLPIACAIPCYFIRGVRVLLRFEGERAISASLLAIIGVYALLIGFSLWMLVAPTFLELSVPVYINLCGCTIAQLIKIPMLFVKHDEPHMRKEICLIFIMMIITMLFWIFMAPLTRLDCRFSLPLIFVLLPIVTFNEVLYYMVVLGTPNNYVATPTMKNWILLPFIAWRSFRRGWSDFFAVVVEVYESAIVHTVPILYYALIVWVRNTEGTHEFTSPTALDLLIGILMTVLGNLSI